MKMANHSIATSSAKGLSQNASVKYLSKIIGSVFIIGLSHPLNFASHISVYIDRKTCILWESVPLSPVCL